MYNDDARLRDFPNRAKQIENQNSIECFKYRFFIRLKIISVNFVIVVLLFPPSNQKFILLLCVIQHVEHYCFIILNWSATCSKRWSIININHGIPYGTFQCVYSHFFILVHRFSVFSCLFLVWKIVLLRKTKKKV